MKRQKIEATVNYGQVTATGLSKESERKIGFEVDWPETLEEAGELLGKEVALALLHGKYTIAAQGFARGVCTKTVTTESDGVKSTSKVDSGVSDSDLQQRVDKWEPSGNNREVGKTANLDKMIDSGASDDDIEKQIKAMIAARRAAKAPTA